MKKIVFTGACSAIPTPFNSSGVNYTVLRDFITFQLKNSVDAIVVCGTSGESATMSFSENLRSFLL